MCPTGKYFGQSSALACSPPPLAKVRCPPPPQLSGALNFTNERMNEQSAVRLAALITAGHNFTHVIAKEKKAEHKLVTSGIYQYEAVLFL